MLCFYLKVGKVMAHNNRKPNMLPYTLKDFQQQFPDDATCLDWLRNYRDPDGIFCEACNAFTKHHRVKSRPSYSCDHCGHHVHPTAGTIFHKSPTPLTIWFYAIYLMASTRCGVSAKQIQRETGVTYKTAWRMFKQIRSMLVEDGDPFGGKGGKPVEMDETYIGGKRRNGSKGRTDATDKIKTPVFGIVERKGRVVAYVTPNVKKETIMGVIWASLKSAFFRRAWSSPMTTASMTILDAIATSTSTTAFATAKRFTLLA